MEQNDSLQLRVLTLNPESEIAATRGRQLGLDPGNFRDQLRRAYEEAKKLTTATSGSRVEIRLYDEYPLK